MFRGKERNHSLKAKHLVPENLIFSMFTADEIRKLAVTKIVTSLTFDSLGHPLPGGLHDLSLGPIDTRNELCQTCCKNYTLCPGHFGCIELPLPVINPLFNKIIATILRYSCITCFKLQVSSHIKYTIAVQIKLLNAGLTAEAIEIEGRVAELIAQYNDFEAIPEENLEIVKEYEKLIDDQAPSQIESGALKTRNTEALKNQFVSGLWRNIKLRRNCIYCKESMQRLSTLRNKLIITSRVKLNDSASGARILQSKHLTPEETKRYLRSIWENEKELIVQLVPVLNEITSEFPTDVFFFDVIPVPPSNVRPANILGGMISEHEQTKIYKEILQANMLLRASMKVMKNDDDTTDLPDEVKAVYEVSKGDSAIEKLSNAWENLQLAVNSLIENNNRNGIDAGLKSIIEKKEGIIRMHMMGKRVNFAARSVITPDPNLNIDEIGIPDAFAKHLTYPVPVTSWNVEEMRKLIMNGPNVHPGAVMVEFEDGSVIRINSQKGNQENLLKRLLTPDGPEKGFKGVKLVHRHLCNGDILLLNRQPTLHRPSIMAHKARILQGEKTLRLHYANCKAYNADFDGDEMNAHFPQNELARSEGYTLANVSNQYLVPKDGTPLSGLIQDHMISGVRMSIRGKFFNRYDYQQLVYQALRFKTSKIITLPPAIMKPQMLWSGKQVLSTVLLNIIPKNKARINLTATAKIPARAWQSEEPRPWLAGGTPFSNPNTMSEGEVVIRQGELLVGILDKTHYGATPYGLIHCVYELYGGTHAIKLLSSFAIVFTYFLQREGFTLGVHDILVMSKPDRKRKRIMRKSRAIGRAVVADALNLRVESSDEVMVEKLGEQVATNPKFRAMLDRQYKTSLDSYTNQINKTCLPAGLVCKFPQNNLQLMVQSGAKGSTVNTMQISCLLGQIELEGKRPPVMISGRSLPSFPPHEFAPRAGGFIDGRFMTGIQPQEFFFHCMAGREGLIDTAVKTSRSGYLQRCLIKHLEGLSVAYDMTVRDSDKSVIQFAYGEDGMDISKAQFLKKEQLQVLYENEKIIMDASVTKHLKDGCHKKIEAHKKSVSEWKGKEEKKMSRSAFSLFSAKVKGKVNIEKNKVSSKTGRDKKTKFIVELWQQSSDDIKSAFNTQSQRCPDPTVSIYQPDAHYGAINERLSQLIEDFTLSEGKKKKRMRKLIELKAMQSMCPPGEPVGLLAAQSIGEPSTQMTLNTFHFAGRGEMNVTLGIPRLREILMLASKNIKTPSMEVPFLDVPGQEKKAERLRRKLTRVAVSDVLEEIVVTQELEMIPQRQHKIGLRFHFMPHELFKKDFHVKPKKIINYMGTKFFHLMFMAINKYAKIHTNTVIMNEDKGPSKAANAPGDEDDPNETIARAGAARNGDADSSSEDEDPEDTEDAKMNAKFSQGHFDLEPEDDDEVGGNSDDEVGGNSDDEEMKENDGEEHESTDKKIKAEDPADDFEVNEKEVESMRSHVVNKHTNVTNFTFDPVNHSWCELTFVMPLNIKKLDMTAVLRDVARKAIIWQTPGIKRAITYVNNGKLTLRTDGINMVEMFKYSKLLDLNKLYSNDIHQIAETYGIEAAMRVIVKEVRDVFNVYGITVDSRHLLLVADYMTYGGTFEPLSRRGMECSSSPLQQMSFESSLTFLKAATLGGKVDKLENPSSCLMVGKPCNTGTGAFTLLQKLQVPPTVS